MASSSSSLPAKYPYPSEVSVTQFIPIKLSETNYFMWEPLMFNFFESQGMAGFINGTISAPLEKITIPDGSFNNGTKEIENEDYRAWRRSDLLVRGWILAMLSEEILAHVVHLETTAKELWEMIKRGVGPLPVDITRNALDEEAGKKLSRYLPLHKAAITGDWESAREFFQKEPEAVRAFITGRLETALIIAVRTSRKNHFVKKLVKLMQPEDLAIINGFGLTALHAAAAVDNIEAAMWLVNKNPNLPNVWDNINHILPLHLAASHGRRKMFLYLLTVTNEDAEPKPFEGEPGNLLMLILIHNGLYDIALSLFQRYPKLVLGEPSPLSPIAFNRSKVPSGMHLNICQRLIYACVPVNLENFGGQSKNPAKSPTSVKQSWLHAVLWSVAEILLPQIKHIREKKMMHYQVQKLVEFICMESVKLDYAKASKLLGFQLRGAIVVGTPEVVEEIMATTPNAIYLLSEKNQTVFHLAIVNRREKVFNLIYQIEELAHLFLSARDVFQNNCLHLAARLEPQALLNLQASVATAALQMQRELQWFKEVEKFAPPGDKERVNIEGMTPTMVFTETHKDLVKEGEKWMKDTAKSCIFVAALIVTIAFASAITVPGGNNGTNGFPILSKFDAFIPFSISNALALFTSTSSMLMFLSILTSRYAEEDFLYALPNRLIIGLLTQFLSILSMMIAFSTALYLVFGDNKKGILIAVIVLACLPTTLFASMQFSFLLKIINSTYGPSIFHKQSDRILY